MKIKFEWERIYRKVSEDNMSGVVTNRSKVLGGWVVRTITWSVVQVQTSESAIFVSDPNHEWEIE